MQFTKILTEIFQRRNPVLDLLYLIEEEEGLARYNVTFVGLLQLVEDSFGIEVGKQRGDKRIVMTIDIQKMVCDVDYSSTPPIFDIFFSSSCNLISYSFAK